MPKSSVRCRIVHDIDVRPACGCAEVLANDCRGDVARPVRDQPLGRRGGLTDRFFAYLRSHCD